MSVGGASSDHAVKRRLYFDCRLQKPLIIDTSLSSWSDELRLEVPFVPFTYAAVAEETYDMVRSDDVVTAFVFLLNRAWFCCLVFVFVVMVLLSVKHVYLSLFCFHLDVLDSCESRNIGVIYGGSVTAHRHTNTLFCGPSMASHGQSSDPHPPFPPPST